MDLKKELEKALEYFIENATTEELKENMYWYGVRTKEDLLNVMYESYLDSYQGEELKERIENLYL